MMVCNCEPCPKIYSGKCSDCPENQAELAEYFGRIERIEKRIGSMLSLSDEAVGA